MGYLVFECAEPGAVILTLASTVSQIWKSMRFGVFSLPTTSLFWDMDWICNEARVRMMRCGGSLLQTLLISLSTSYSSMLLTI